MKQIFINFNFSIFDLNLTTLDLVFLTMVISMTLVNFHMSGKGRKIGQIGKNVVTGLVGVYNFKIGEKVLGGKDESKSETSNNNSNDSSNQSSTNSSGNNREGTKTVKFLFFQYKNSFQQQYSLFLLSLLSYLGKDISQEVEPLFNFTTSILLLTIGAFVSFIRIVLYILSVHYIEKYNLYEKYPKYQKWIRHFEKFRAYSIVYEIIISSFIFIMIISLCIFMIWVLLQ